MFGGPVILWRIEILGFVPAWETSQNSAAANKCSGICIIYLICFAFWYPALKLFFFQRYDGRREKIYNSELYDDVLKFGVITILTWEGKLSKNLWELAEFELACSLDCWSAALEVFSLLGLATSSRTRDCFLISLRREKTGAFRFSLLKTGNCGDLSFFVACVSYSCNADSNSLQTARQASFVVDRD